MQFGFFLLTQDKNFPWITLHGSDGHSLGVDDVYWAQASYVYIIHKQI